MLSLALRSHSTVRRPSTTHVHLGASSTVDSRVHGTVSSQVIPHTRYIVRRQALEMQHRSIRERLESFRSQEMHGITTLKQLMTLQSLDDCFYIWHRGQVGTINCFRLLRHPLLQQVC
mmetsp:Transcript_8244/g.25498  ORF Transcript_8244/g.25498 Transcript_8244/m.25498 type:complete len:118 (+) Transcript_8244:182-535(+)